MFGPYPYQYIQTIPNPPIPPCQHPGSVQAVKNTIDVRPEHPRAHDMGGSHLNRPLRPSDPVASVRNIDHQPGNPLVRLGTPPYAKRPTLARVADRLARWLRPRYRVPLREAHLASMTDDVRHSRMRMRRDGKRDVISIAPPTYTSHSHIV